MAETVRNPKQLRSIDKKNRIIEAGYRLLAKNGYYSTNTAMIAKEAGVSTGIVYGYFRDKRDILIEVLNVYVNKVFEPVFAMFDKIQAPFDFDSLLKNAVESVVQVHQDNSAIHAALHSLTHSDELVKKRFTELENEMTIRVAECLEKGGYRSEDLKEKVHLAMRCIQDFAHEYIYDHHEYLSYPQMKNLLVEMLKRLFD